MTKVFHRHLQTDYPTAVEGDGPYIIDADGKRYLDGCSGAAVSCLGHSNEEVREAIAEQVSKLAYAHSGFFTTEPMEELADFLIERAPGELDKVYFVSGGSEAVECAIKMAKQYFLEIGKPEKKRVIARWQSYHGNTLGALSAGGNKFRRAQFDGILIESMSHITPCFEYRYRNFDSETEFEFGQRVANELEEEILKHGAENVCAFVAEPVVGATLGCVPAVEGYFKRIREICDKYEVLLILDEVMCGMGRTGSLFASEQEGVTGDLLCIAKGLGAGYQPIGAVLAHGKIHDAIKNGSGFFQHGHTYIGHATACAASLKVQEIIERDGLLDNVKQKSEKIFSRLNEQFGEHENVGNIRGRGLFIGLEIVQGTKDKATFDPSHKVNAKIKKAAFSNGLMCYAMGGTVDGKNGDHLMLAPPFIINDEHVEEIVDKLSRSINQTLKSL